MASSISSVALPRCFLVSHGSHKSSPWPSSSNLILNYSSKHHRRSLLSLSSSPASVVETDEMDDLNFSGCRGCGKEEKESGCNGDGRIQGGIATVPGFGWWPIKAYRPCPAFVEAGGRYRRIGQSMDEVAFGRGDSKPSTPKDKDTTDPQLSCVSNEAQEPSSMEEEAREVEIDKDLRKKIKKTVQKILKRSSLYQMTEIKVREQASSELDLDLSQDPYKLIVREAVESFVEEAITVVDNKIGKLQILKNFDEEKTPTLKKKKKKKESKESSS